MDEGSQAEFDRIIKLNPEELLADDRAFLTARRDYLTKDQQRIFADVIKPIETEPELYVAKKDRT